MEQLIYLPRHSRYRRRHYDANGHDYYRRLVHRQAARQMAGRVRSYFGLSSVLGPQIGGWSLTPGTGDWVFYINLACRFLASGLLLFAYAAKAEGPVKFDWAGIFTMVVGVVSFLLGLSLGGMNFALASWQIIGMFVLAVVSLSGSCGSNPQPNRFFRSSVQRQNLYDD